MVPLPLMVQLCVAPAGVAVDVYVLPVEPAHVAEGPAMVHVGMGLIVVVLEQVPVQPSLVTVSVTV